MANRVPATIEIGGLLPASLVDTFVAIIQSEGLSTDWDGEPFTHEALPDTGMLRLMDNEVAWGEFGNLEAFCRAHGLSYVRWCGAYGSEWGAQRVVFPGTGEPVTYAATEDDQIVIDKALVAALGSMAAIDAHFAAADSIVPALRIDTPCGPEGMPAQEP